LTVDDPYTPQPLPQPLAARRRFLYAQGYQDGAADAGDGRRPMNEDPACATREFGAAYLLGYGEGYEAGAGPKEEG
jgi:hypothetical protein